MLVGRESRYEAATVNAISFSLSSGQIAVILAADKEQEASTNWGR